MTCSLFSADVTSSEDESRFTARDYTQTEPGLLSPKAYIEIAKKALRDRYKDIAFHDYEEPFVKRRFYKDASPPDREIICVKFVYSEPTSPPGQLAVRFPPAKGPVFPVLLVLIRKDLSKVYVNEVYYQIW
ncbi:MAG TPA: hypothetical protein VGI60_15110 [Chthoniobacterales bacterium]